MALFTNQATLTYNDVVTNSNVATGELLEVLSAVKTAVQDTYRVGDEVTYVVSLLNSGPSAVTGLTLTDDLGGYQQAGVTRYPLTYVEGSVLYYVNGVLQPAPTVTAGPPLTIGGLSVPAGGNAVVVYAASVNRFAPQGVADTIVNTVTVTGGGLSSPITATETVTAAETADLTITKGISPAVVTENSRVTYTFTIQNYGNTPAIATDNAAISDLFDPILTDLAVTYNGTTWTEPANYSYDETTGLFTTVPGQITVPAATYTQDPSTGLWTVTPGVSVLTVVGTI